MTQLSALNIAVLLATVFRFLVLGIPAHSVSRDLGAPVPQGGVPESAVNPVSPGLDAAAAGVPVPARPGGDVSVIHLNKHNQGPLLKCCLSCAHNRFKQASPVSLLLDRSGVVAGAGGPSPELPCNAGIAVASSPVATVASTVSPPAGERDVY
jgi:hypothetical protein